MNYNHQQDAQANGLLTHISEDRKWEYYTWYCLWGTSPYIHVIEFQPLFTMDNIIPEIKGLEGIKFSV